MKNLAGFSQIADEKNATTRRERYDPI